MINDAYVVVTLIIKVNEISLYYCTTYVVLYVVLQQYYFGNQN